MVCDLVAIIGSHLPCGAGSQVSNNWGESRKAELPPKVTAAPCAGRQDSC